jgi:HD superfamily phosphohydrolase
MYVLAKRSTNIEGEQTMQLRFLGKSTNGGHSPTLYATDRSSYVVQGWKIEGHEDQIEIPHPLLAYLEKGTCLGALLHDTGHGTFTLSGEPVTDPEALAQMDLPGHETSVEVPVGQEIRRDAAPSE